MVSLLSDALRLPSGVSKNEQGVLYHCLDAMISEQGFPCRHGQVWVKKLAQHFRIRLATWNIRSLLGKTMELVDVMSRSGISIACMQETKLVEEKVKEIENTDISFTLVGIRIDKGMVLKL